MLRSLTAAVLTLLLGTFALAQSQTDSVPTEKIFPNSPGIERGVSSVNNSGQVGTATLHKVAGSKTDVVLNIRETVSGRPELAGVVRNPSASCDNPPKGPFNFYLQPVVGGRSHSQIRLSIDELLSGNYFVIVYSKEKPSHYFACGRLYR